MDQIKIGKFISEKRKEKNITQSKLAEMLNITDRAISKWETGLCMPDASNIKELCKILDISINDLFSGEVIDMKNYDKKADENLLELKKNDEEKNKMLLKAMYIIEAVSMFSLLTFTFLIAYFIPEGLLQTILVFVVLIIFMIPCFIGFKFEVQAGFYECKNCKHKFVPKYTEALMASHIGTTRHLLCPKCNKKTWCKKRITDK